MDDSGFFSPKNIVQTIDGAETWRFEYPIPFLQVIALIYEWLDFKNIEADLPLPQINPALEQKLAEINKFLGDDEGTPRELRNPTSGYKNRFLERQYKKLRSQINSTPISNQDFRLIFAKEVERTQVSISFQLFFEDTIALGHPGANSLYEVDVVPIRVDLGQLKVYANNPSTTTLYVLMPKLPPIDVPEKYTTTTVASLSMPVLPLSYNPPPRPKDDFELLLEERAKDQLALTEFQKSALHPLLAKLAERNTEQILTNSPPPLAEQLSQTAYQLVRGILFFNSPPPLAEQLSQTAVLAESEPPESASVTKATPPVQQIEQKQNKPQKETKATQRKSETTEARKETLGGAGLAAGKFNSDNFKSADNHLEFLLKAMDAPTLAEYLRNTPNDFEEFVAYTTADTWLKRNREYLEEVRNNLRNTKENS